MIGEGGLRQSLFALVIGEGGALHQLTNWCVGEGSDQTFELGWWSLGGHRIPWGVCFENDLNIKTTQCLHEVIGISSVVTGDLQ